MSMRTLVAGSALVGLVGLLTLTGCHAIGQHFSDTRTEPASINEIRIQGDSGSVKIDRGGSPTKIDRTVNYQDQKPSGRSDRVEGSVLILNTNCAPRRCSVDYQVSVPASVKVTGSLDSGRIDVRSITTATLRTDSGRITVEDATGDVTATTDSGRIDANSIKGRLNLQTNSGSVHSSGVGGTLVIQTDSGSVHADGVAGGQTTVRTQSGSVGVDVASEQDVKVTTDSGRIDLTVPKGGAFRVDGRSDSGRVQINIPQTSTGHLIEVSSDSGSIQVDEGNAAPVAPASPSAQASPSPATAPSAPSAPSSASPPPGAATPSPK